MLILAAFKLSVLNHRAVRCAALRHIMDITSSMSLFGGREGVNLCLTLDQATKLLKRNRFVPVGVTGFFRGYTNTCRYSSAVNGRGDHIISADAVIQGQFSAFALRRVRPRVDDGARIGSTASP